MKRIVIASVVMMLLFAVAAQAQTTPPGPEHKKLGVWLGTWTGEGKWVSNKGETTKTTASCSWFTGEYQMVCNTEDSDPSGNSKGQFVMGYSLAKKQFLGFSISSSGNTVVLTGRVEGSTWTWTGDDRQGRLVVNFASPTEYTYKVEYSEDGKSWKLAGEGKLTKK
jgi:lipocalin